MRIIKKPTPLTMLMFAGVCIVLSGCGGGDSAEPVPAAATPEATSGTRKSETTSPTSTGEESAPSTGRGVGTSAQDEGDAPDSSVASSPRESDRDDVDDSELTADSDKTITYLNGEQGPGSGTESNANASSPNGKRVATTTPAPEPETEPDLQAATPDDYRYPPSQSAIGGTDSDGNAVPGYKSRQGTHISGMTRTRVSSNSAFGVSNGKARHQYSKRQVWNRDETLLMVGGALLDASDFSIKRKYVPLSSERNWSNRDPDKLFGIKHPNSFASYRPSTDKVTTLRTFDQYSKCTIGDHEGNLSNDDGFVMLACSGNGGKTLVSYDIANDRILGTMKARGDYNWGSFTPSGKYIVVENNSVNGKDNEELLRFSPTFGQQYKLTDDRHHGDFGTDENGDDVYVMISWDVMSYIRIRDGARVTLGASNKNNGIGHGHVSCRNIDRPGWCYFSAGRYRIGSIRLGISDPKPTGTHYNGQPRYRGVAQWEPWGYHRSSWRDYAVQPKASVSWSGTKMIVTSDWYGKGEVNDYVFEFTQ